MNNGWQKPFGSFEFLFMRKIPTTVFAALISAPVSVPFELTRIAYYADKTFPKELQRGYTSYFNALTRIPFEEGPYYLFKNSAPIYVKNFLSSLTMFYLFDFLKDKASWMWRVINLFRLEKSLTYLVKLRWQDFPLIWLVLSLTLLRLQLEKWSSYGLKKRVECAPGKEITERQ